MKEIIKADNIKNKIYFIRGVQVMLDRDLAELYGVETKVFNQAVKRNLDRFPETFKFKIKSEEFDNLRSQIVTSSYRHGGRRYLPYVFSELGVAMLAGVLKSEIAVKMSIQIIEAFVEMKNILSNNAVILQNIHTIEQKQLIVNTRFESKFEKIFKAIEAKNLKPKQGIFYNGEIFDAYKFVSDLFRSAKKSILIIDNYIDDTVLVHLTKASQNVSINILTKHISDQLKLDIIKFKEQYFSVKVQVFKDSHDRFIIIDNKDVYHLGASLKDLGNKWFAFSKMNINVGDILNKIKDQI